MATRNAAWTVIVYRAGDSLTGSPVALYNFIIFHFQESHYLVVLCVTRVAAREGATRKDFLRNEFVLRSCYAGPLRGIPMVDATTDA